MPIHPHDRAARGGLPRRSLMSTLRSNLAAALLTGLLCCSAGAAIAAPQAEAGAPRTEALRALYWQGHQALGNSDWNAALSHFRQLEQQLAADAREPADAAIYWQAYALSQAKRSREAQREVERLRQSFPNSVWLDEAGALVAAAAPASRKTSTTRVDDRSEDADALMAIDALLVGESERAVPLLQKVLASEHGDQVKQRAMFVLSQLDGAAADAALGSILAGTASPRLQQEAIKMIAVGGRRAALDRLLALYRSNPDRGIRNAVMDAFLIGDRGDLMQQLIEAETDPAPRREAIHKLGAMGDGERLKALYASRSDRDDRLQVLHAFGIAGEIDALADAARGETDPDLRAEALRGIGIGGGKQAGPLLLEFYRSSNDARTRQAALDGLLIAGDSAAMLELYRQETDPELRRKLLHHLTSADPDAALELIDAALKR